MSITEQIAALRREADELERIRTEFPDVRRMALRWRHPLVSPAVNAAPEACELAIDPAADPAHALALWFSVRRGDMRVYTDPPFVSVGGADMDSETLAEDWEARVRAAIGDHGVELARPRVSQYFREDAND